jgi:uncharacterized protein YcaQ
MDFFHGEPDLVPMEDGFHWKLLSPYIVDDDVLGTLIVPEGFVPLEKFTTDFGSIPKAFQNIIPPEGRPLRAYIVHDWLYARQKFTRKQSDDCLMRMMKALEVGWIERWTIYTAVRLGGWWSWRQDAKAYATAFAAGPQTSATAAAVSASVTTAAKETKDKSNA